MGVAVGVGVVVRDEGGRVLLGRREKAGEPVTWSLPGGALEAGESFEQAAVRELAEETTLRAGVVTVVGMGLTHRPGHGPGWTVAAVATSVEGEAHVAAQCPASRAPAPLGCASPPEFATVDWFAEHELPEPLFGPTRYVLDAVAGRVGRETSYAVTAR